MLDIKEDAFGHTGRHSMKGYAEKVWVGMICDIIIRELYLHGWREIILEGRFLFLHSLMQIVRATC